LAANTDSSATTDSAANTDSSATTDTEGWFAGDDGEAASRRRHPSAAAARRPVTAPAKATPAESPAQVTETPNEPKLTSTARFPRFIENPEPTENISEPVDKREEKKTRRASNVSMNALARRGMSTKEMTSLLEQRELEPDDVESEIARLEGVGLLDDSALAENLVRTLQDRKKLGKSAINAELRRRKVDESAIAEAMETVDSDDELERATEIAVKRAGQLSSYDRETAQRRLGGFLQRRGYSGQIVSAAIKIALDESHGARGSSSGPRFR